MATSRRLADPRVWTAVFVLMFAGVCAFVAVVGVVSDRTTLLGTAYLQAVNSGNRFATGLLTDHYTSAQGGTDQLYSLDVDRDIAYLKDAQLQNVTATRDETLSGQPVVVVRFEWRPPESAGPWQNGALRIKLDRWLFMTYIRAVEQQQP